MAARYWSFVFLVQGVLFAEVSPPPRTPSEGSKIDEDEIIATSLAPKPDPDTEEFWQAVGLLQSKKPADTAAGRTALQKVADQEYTHAQVLLGNCLLSGSYGFKKDERKATNFFRLAAERGNAFAKVSLGSCYATGTGVRKDEAKAVEWLTAALAPNADFSRPLPPTHPLANDAASGVAGELSNDPASESQATAHFLLGQIFSQQKKNAEAQLHYVAAATAGTDGRSGIYAAAVQAALNYAFGQGVPRDQAKANAMLEQSRRLTTRMTASLIHNYVALKMVDEFAVADLEESATEAGAGFQSTVQLQIAAALADKKSKDYNVAEAVKWYELAAENGQAWAMLPLAFIYVRGDLGQPDAVKAFQWFEKAGAGEKPKHFLGVANLAICCQNGIGTPKDTARAAALFAKYRETEIVCHLGSIGQCPTAPLTFEQVLALNETWAKQKNDSHAQYLLGLRYSGGLGVPVDDREAVRWFKKAAAAGHGGALCQLGVLYEFNPSVVGESSQEKAFAIAVDYYRKGYAAGNVDAGANYAGMLFDGRGIQRDLAKAEEVYRKCLQLNPRHARTHNNLGAVYEAKLRLEPAPPIFAVPTGNRALMLEQYEEAVRLKFPYAASNLGKIYYEGTLTAQDFRKAYRYFEQAVEWGLPAEHFHLGYMHEQGEGVPVTYTEAAYHYRLAALEGHREALRRLINFYLTGKGVSLDLERAVFWMQQMVRLGNPRVLTNLCDVLMKKGDYATALPLLRQLSESSESTLAGYGFDRLAVCYGQGLGVKANAARAKKYHEQAVKMGDGDALTQLGMRQAAEGKIQEALSTFTRAAPRSRAASYYLGQMYYLGTNVEKNEQKGIQFLKAAANLNHPDALFALAILTYNRASGAPTLDEAIQFAQQAENVGHTKAGELREKLEQRRKTLNERPE